MSQMEVNKGKLIPFEGDIEKLAEQIVFDSDLKFYDSKLEALKENAFEYGYEMIKGKLYKVDWEIEGGDLEGSIVDLKVNEDGSINFFTYHYNGCAHWTELVEEGLK